MNHVRFGQLHAVAIDLLVDDLDVIAGNAHHALHEGLADVHRIAEHDDIAVAGSLIGQDVLAEAALRCEGKLVHQQMIADQQRVFHGAGGNHEGLNQEGGAEQQQQNGDGPFGDSSARRFLRCRFSRRDNWRRRGQGGGIGCSCCFSAIRSGFHSVDIFSLSGGGSLSEAAVYLQEASCRREAGPA